MNEIIRLNVLSARHFLILLYWLDTTNHELCKINIKRLILLIDTMS